jgi:parallel beta-helix repeat protein
MDIRKITSLRRLGLALLCAGAGFGLLVGGNEAVAQKTVTVCASFCDFTQIQTAIDTVPSGTVIEVKAGMYTENLTIRNKQDLTLHGVGRDQVTLDGSAGVAAQKPGILIENSKKITIRGLTIVKSRRGVHMIKSTGVVITNNSFKDNIRQGIAMNGSKAQVIGNLIQDTQPDRSDRGGAHGQGINLFGPGVSEAVIVENTISGNWHFGILVQVGAQATIQKNTISGNGKSGRGVDDGAGNVGGIAVITPRTTATIEDNTIADNRMFGIWVASIGAPAVATLARNRITGTKKDIDDKNGIGLFVAENGKATLMEDVITGSQDAGIVVTDSASVTVEKGTINENDLYGVYATFNASIALRQTTVSSNKATGIQIGATDVADEAVQAEVSGSTVQKNGQCGVFVDGEIPSRNVTGQGNTISENVGGQLCGKTSTFPTGFGGGK